MVTVVNDSQLGPGGLIVANADRDRSLFDGLLATMRRLRAPEEGCPWDLEQTHGSLRNSLLEEAYEALEAIDANEPEQMVEELGDVLLQVVFHAQIGADAGRFTIDDVVQRLTDKLVSRHPHVFGDEVAGSAGEVLGQWERIKAQERAARGHGERSMLDGVPKSMPALAYAQAVAARAGRAGFDFESDAAALAKLSEEIAELRDAESAALREAEMGDVLFMAAVNAARMGIDAEAALRGSNDRFARRFRHLEGAVRQGGTALVELGTDAKRMLWEEAKRAAS